MVPCSAMQSSHENESLNVQRRQAKCQLGYYYYPLAGGGRRRKEEEGGGRRGWCGGVGGDVIMRSYLFHLPPLEDNGPFVDTGCHGGSCRAPQDTDGVIMLCHQ